MTITITVDIDGRVYGAQVCDVPQEICEEPLIENYIRPAMAQIARNFAIKAPA